MGQGAQVVPTLKYEKTKAQGGNVVQGEYS